MRKKIVAGNWKMNLDYATAMALAEELVHQLPNDMQSQVILAPPYVYLHDVAGLAQDHPSVSVGAQNCSDKYQGAFTGEVAASMLSSIGIDYVIIGHSERRIHYNENNALLAKKISVVLEQQLLPIYCCGETTEQRNSNSHLDYVKKQLEEGLFHLDKNKFSQCTIAYEPVWAIGTGTNATSVQVQEMHLYIRGLIGQKYGEQSAQNMTILYGGSITSKNAGELFSCLDVDGGLVGGASLKADEFLDIIRELEKTIK